MAQLLTLYTPALRTFLVASRSAAPDAADDILQDFILAKVLDPGFMARADQARGRFRSYLLKSLSNFASTSRRRGARVQLTDMDDHREDPVDPASLSHVDSFEKAWLQQVLRDALDLMHADCVRRGRNDIWAIFSLRVVEPARDDTAPVDYNEIVGRLNIGTPREAINLLVTARRAFARHLRAAVARYTKDEAAVDAEIADLRAIAGRVQG